MFVILCVCVCEVQDGAGENRLYLSLGMCVFQLVTMKFKTVREGQQAIILSHMGEGELVVGPKRVSSAQLE